MGASVVCAGVQGARQWRGWLQLHVCQPLLRLLLDSIHCSHGLRQRCVEALLGRAAAVGSCTCGLRKGGWPVCDALVVPALGLECPCIAPSPRVLCAWHHTGHAWLHTFPSCCPPPLARCLQFFQAAVCVHESAHRGGGGAAHPGGRLCGCAASSAPGTCCGCACKDVFDRGACGAHAAVTAV